MPTRSAVDTGPPPAEAMNRGCFPVSSSRHSSHPSAGMRHRLRWNAVRNAGFSCTVSARALMSRAPIFTSFAHAGISAHRSFATARSELSSRHTVKSCVGHPLQRGRKFSGVACLGMRYRSWSFFQDIACVNRPHIAPDPARVWLPEVTLPSGSAARHPHSRSSSDPDAGALHRLGAEFPVRLRIAASRFTIEARAIRTCAIDRANFCPSLRPRACAASSLAKVHSRIRSSSNSGSAAKIPNTRRRVPAVVSIRAPWPAGTRWPTPRADGF